MFDLNKQNVKFLIVGKYRICLNSPVFLVFYFINFIFLS